MHFVLFIDFVSWKVRSIYLTPILYDVGEAPAPNIS